MVRLTSPATPEATESGSAIARRRKIFEMSTSIRIPVRDLDGVLPDVIVLRDGVRDVVVPGVGHATAPPQPQC